MSKQDKHLSKKDFTLQAIEQLRDLEKGKGIHAVYTGFNAAFRAYFPGADVVKDMADLQEQGHVSVVPAKGGVRIYKASEAPTSADSTLRKILSK